ncbi:hypothetical protein Aab01nite_05680 [Paractinoplanes abujensis]|uniref:8-oxo-dGTP pyrophosphatase MutT (NUDIX family) n=1 Tax=Paractinoplanes abujensis TaxID=882441 RepID=A0A7W7CN42_9ACTN|nr:NUDIX hydrolase [Actinoplanes abujensis]MBB4691603.1 8-oxo-dGTP pyrophosphatase MutT (NUDIX family) [Actinoplanes abujensis]GID16978.1 hypothetical protein Aab01nite_05680 [Actinoplanes abujensis]
MPVPAERPPRDQVVTALLRDGDRLLLCYRSPRKRNNADVWDLPGGLVEPGELPAAALVRELREELGIDIAPPSGPPDGEVHGDTFDIQIWVIETWTGSPINAAPEEHDAIAWFTEDALPGLKLGVACLALLGDPTPRHRTTQKRTDPQRHN